VVLFVGWLAALKGIPELIEAIARLAAQRPAIKLVSIGAGILESELKSRAAQPDLNGRVLFLGRRGPEEIARLAGGM
jgi:glycosyltransferase involved in cell wall biosynthesis